MVGPRSGQTFCQQSRVGPRFHRVGSGQRFAGSGRVNVLPGRVNVLPGRVGSKKSDLWTTLGHGNWHGHQHGLRNDKAARTWP